MDNAENAAVLIGPGQAELIQGDLQRYNPLEAALALSSLDDRQPVSISASGTVGTATPTIDGSYTLQVDTDGAGHQLSQKASLNT
jgi:hypothetical protein